MALSHSMCVCECICGNARGNFARLLFIQNCENAYCVYILSTANATQTDTFWHLCVIAFYVKLNTKYSIFVAKPQKHDNITTIICVFHFLQSKLIHTAYRHIHLLVQNSHVSRSMKHMFEF